MVDGTGVDAASGEDSTGSASLTVTPPQYAFGGVPTGTASAEAAFTVENVGTGPTGALTVTISGVTFAAVNDACSGRTLAPGETCSFGVTYTPTELVDDNGSADVAEPGGANASSTLTGSGISPDGLVLTPGSHPYGTVILGTTPGSARFTLTNNATIATGALTIAISGPNASEFAAAHSCTTLAATASCTIDVSMSPASAGDKMANLEVSATPGGTLSAPLTATVLTPAALALTAASGTSFGDVVMGSSSDLTFIVSNGGGQDTGPVTITLTGADYAVLTGVAGDCVSGTTVLGFGDSCNVRVRFTPTATGARNATLQAAATPGGTQTLTLTGNGLAPGQLSGDITMHNFGIVEVGVVSSAVVWTITNAGGVATGVPSLTNGNPTEVAVTNNCTGALAPGGNCTISSTFRPSAGGARSGTLSLSATPGGSASLSLSADGRWRLTVNKTGTGTVSGTGITCGADCTELLAHNSVVTIQATTTNGSGYHFQSWSGSCTGSFRDCTLTMNQAHTANANFSTLGPNLAFVSSATYPATFGSAAAADTACNSLANAAGIGSAAGGTFRAWLSDSASNAITRIGSGTGGLRRLDDRIFTTSVSDLLNKKILYPLNVTEQGQVLGPVSVWSATNDNGTVRTAHCNNWTSTTAGADDGSATGGPGFWTVWSAAGCGGNRRLYCIQNASTAAITPPSIPAGSKIAYYVNGFVPGGGLTAANNFCNGNKPPVYAARTFRALLATTTQSVSNIVNLSANYFRPDGALVGTGADLAAGTIRTGLWYHHDGVYGGGNVLVWTGSTSPGSVGTSATTCNNWTDGTATGTGRQGRVNFSDSAWWNVGSPIACNFTRALYCVEQ